MNIYYIYPLQASLDIGNSLSIMSSPPEILVCVADDVEQALDKFKILFLNEEPDFDFASVREAVKATVVEKPLNDPFLIHLVRG